VDPLVRFQEYLLFGKKINCVIVEKKNGELCMVELIDSALLEFVLIIYFLHLTLVKIKKGRSGVMV
jgi:hypothetical protein